MEVTIIKGKKEGSEHFVVPSLNQIFVKKEKKNCALQFVKCYHYKNGCRARGRIDSAGFHESEGIFGTHSNHSHTTFSVINYLAFFNEIKNEARSSGKLPNVIFDEAMLK